MTVTEHLEEGYRSFGKVDDVDDGRHEVVVEFPHDVLDSYRTDWGARCFDESLNEMLPPLLWNHDRNDLIGRAYKFESDGRRTRLFSRFSDFDAVPRARQAFAQIRDDDVPGFSFHYVQGRTVAHPSGDRGARRFIKARMIEHSPVTAPSIPGAVAVGIRSQEGVLEIPTIEEIFALQDRKVLDEEGVRALISEHHPHYREHIKVNTTSATAGEDRLAELVAPLVESGLRDLTIHIASDGTVSTDGAGTDGGDSGGGDDGDDTVTLAQATDAALDEACRLLDTVDAATLPDTVQQAVALIQAASVAVDELLDQLGVADPDEDGQVDDTGDRAALSAAEEKKLSDSDFAYVDSKGGRHLPIHDPPHARNALARFDQTHFESDTAKAAARKKVDAAAKKFGIDTSSDGDRSEDTDGEDNTLDLSASLDRLAKYR